VSFECAFRVQGRLSPDVLAALEPLRPARAATETELRGVVADQAALHGLLARFDALGVEIVEFIRLPAPR
jgi:glycine/D-amino acid oxidase-like deaminating enzyme